MSTRDRRVYPARVERVTDGDTIRVLLDHGCYLRSTQAIRLLDVDAPELAQPGGSQARDHIATWLVDHATPGDDWPYDVALMKDRRSFNRYVGDISCHTCGDSLNDAMRHHLTGAA